MAVISNDQNELIRLLMRDRVTVRRTGQPSALRNPLVAASALVALFGMLALLYVAQAGSLVDTNYNIARLKQEQAYIQASNEQLRLEIVKLQAMERLEREAQLRGMVKPKDFLYVQIEPVTKKKATATSSETNAPASPFHELWQNVMAWLQRALGS